MRGSVADVKPWAGYVRVSHVGGRSGERFHSPQEQSDSIAAWARARRVEVDILPAELDESGGRADRPILTRAVEGIERGEYAGLVVAYLSRASRSVRHLLELWDRIEAAGGQVVAVAENVDTTTPAGRLTRTMLAAIAEHELDLHRERFETLRANATARGVWQRRQLPLGYVKNEHRRLTPSPDAGRVRQAFHDAAAGRALSHIAVDLQMTPSGVRQLLRNRVYLGELKVGEHVNAAAHEPIVSESEHLAAQRAIGARPSRSRSDVALLSGLVRCASCGHLMARSHVSYTCHRQHSAGMCPGPATIATARLDEYVEQIALRELERLRARPVRQRTAVDRARKALGDAETELTAYLEAVSAADVGVQAFAQGARARRENVEAARRELAEIDVSAIPIDGDPARLWPKLSARHRNLALRGLLETVLVAPAGRGRRVQVSDRVRVIAHGAGLIPSRVHGQAMPLVAITLPNGDNPFVLGMQVAQDGLPGDGG